MVIPDSNPIQFWLNGVLTFNEKPEDGVVGQFFRQIFNYDDVVRIQFSDNAFSQYSVVVVDKFANVLKAYDFFQPGGTVNVWEVQFTPNEFVGEDIYLFIVDTLHTLSKIYAPKTSPALTTFANHIIPAAGSYFSASTPGTASWTLGATPSRTSSGLLIYQFLYLPFITKSGRKYQINYTINNGTNGANLFLVFWDKNFAEVVDTSGFAGGADLTASGVLTGSLIRAATGDGVYVGIVLQGGGTVNTTTVTAFSISEWVDEVVGGVNPYSTKTSTQLTRTLSGASTPMAAYQYLSLPDGSKAKFNIDFLFTGAANSAFWEVLVESYNGDKDSGGTLRGQYGWSPPTMTGAPVAGTHYTIPVDLSQSIGSIGVSDRLYIKLFTPSTGSAGNVVLTLPIGQAFYFSSYLAQSDAISILAVQPNTKLIQYSNAKNFAGIDFTNAEVFGFRVSAKFFQQQTPETDESEDITSGTVTLSGTLKRQRFLQIEPAPYYIMEKLKLILKHNTIAIDGKLWANEAGMSTPIMDERFPYYTADCWLTDIESFVSNVYGNITSI